MRGTVIGGLLWLAVGALVGTAAAQDPKVDLPWRRVDGRRVDGRRVEGSRVEGSFSPVWSAVSCLKTGWNWEAARMARELLVQDKDRALPYLLLALATREQPNRAARYCWEAVQRREGASKSERILVSSYRHYFGVSSQPELVDERFASPPDQKSQQWLVGRLSALAKIHRAAATPEGVPAPEVRDLATELHALELARLQQMSAGSAKANAGVPITPSVLTAHATYLHTRNTMPFLLPGYARTLAESTTDDAARKTLLARLPKHPQHPQQLTDAVVGAFPALYATPSATGGRQDSWQPRSAPGFDLARGVGGRGNYADYAGKPVLVVFFLGFGCAHCVAQLKDLDPRAPKFRAAGIEVVSIGTHDRNQVRAARQAAAENGVDPLHFDVLCDPKGEVFKQWGVWDQFDDEALHGTFLVDGKGRILWQDISKRPFEESDWLLSESQRLLSAWR